MKVHCIPTRLPGTLENCARRILEFHAGAYTRPTENDVCARDLRDLFRAPDRGGPSQPDNYFPVAKYENE